MSPFDPRKPRRDLITKDGVQVFVREPPAPDPIRPAPPEPSPRVVVRPPEGPAREQQERFRKLCDEYGAFIERELLRRGDVLAESAKDLRQRVLEILWEQIEEEPPENLKAYLRVVIRNVAANHKRVLRPEPLPGDDEDTEMADSRDPERAATQAELQAKIERYLGELPEEEAQVVRCVHFWKMTLDQTAEAVGRPRGTVSTQLTRGKKMLRDIARASERATKLGADGGLEP